MKKLKIPITLDLRIAAQHAVQYQGYVPLNTLSRLTQMLAGDEGEVTVSLVTGIDEQGLLFLKGEADVVVEAECQRCNENMTLELNATFAYSPAIAGSEDEESELMPERYDEIEFNEFGEIELRTLIEDELILTMPLVAKHDEQDCPARGRPVSWGKIEEVKEDKPNPFAALAQLKRH